MTRLLMRAHTHTNSCANTHANTKALAAIKTTCIYKSLFVNKLQLFIICSGLFTVY